MEKILLPENTNRRKLSGILLFFITLPTVLLFRMIFPVLQPDKLVKVLNDKTREIFAKWEDGKVHKLPQDFADMLGWREVSGLAVQAYEQVPVAERKNTLILCDNYGQAGAINYYAGNKVRPAVSFSADYVYWFPEMDSLHYLIVVGEELGEHVRKYASGYAKTGQISNPLAREYGTGIYIVQGISPDFLKKLGKWQLEEQASFRAWK